MGSPRDSHSAPPLLDRNRRSNTYLATVFFAPTGIIVALGIVLILSLLKASALRLDQSQHNAERRLAQSVVTTLVTTLEKSTADYANWDDMYDQFATRPDPQWVKENLGAYATDAFNLTHILVFGADGTLRYAFMALSAADVAPEPADITALNGFVRSAMASWQRGTVKASGGAMTIHGRPHLLAVSPIAVNSETRQARGEMPANALIFVHGLDEANLRAIASDFGLTGLRVTAAEEGIVPLMGPLGTASTLSLTWANSEVGSRFVSDAIPSIVLVGATVILLLIVLAFAWAAVLGRIRLAAVAAEEASRTKSLFIANMTHELRTPLNAIIGFSELISEETFGPLTVPKYKEYALDIVSSGHHLLAVVNNILLFSKLEAKRQEFDIDRLDLAHAVAHVARVMQIEADRRNVRLTLEPVSATVVVKTDKQALRQILFNLVGNAIKFSSEGSEVHIRPDGTTSNGMFRLQIVDRGCGIPAHTLSQLGGAFVQADNTFSRKHQGTGLGLAISFGLAEQIGASIEIDSTENVGTTVSILLPLSDKDRATETPSHRSGAVTGRHEPAAA